MDSLKLLSIFSYTIILYEVLQNNSPEKKTLGQHWIVDHMSEQFYYGTQKYTLAFFSEQKQQYAPYVINLLFLKVSSHSTGLTLLCMLWNAKLYSYHEYVSTYFNKNKLQQISILGLLVAREINLVKNARTIELYWYSGSCKCSNRINQIIGSPMSFNHP